MDDRCFCKAYLGLRAMEAIRSRDRLIVWERQLAQGQTVMTQQFLLNSRR